MKKRKLALLFLVVFFAITELSLIGIILMWHSSTFIPVYVAGKYIMANQVVRYIVYIVLAIIGFVSFFATMYYWDKLTEKPKRHNRKNK